MQIETDSPAVAAKYILAKLRKGRGAKVVMPNKAEFYFANSQYFGDEAAGLYVSCSKGGCVVIQSPERVNRFMFIKARMSGWAAKFAVETIKELLRIGKGSNPVHAKTAHVHKIGVTPERKRK